VATFLNTINRRGLARPADYTFLLCLHCWRVFQELRTNTALMTKFLAVTCHPTVFINVIDRLTSNYMCNEDMIGDNFCCKGHDLRRRHILMQECAKFDFDAGSTPESSASGSDERQHQPAPQLPPAQSNAVVIDIGLAVDNRNVTHDGERLQLLENEWVPPQGFQWPHTMHMDHGQPRRKYLGPQHFTGQYSCFRYSMTKQGVSSALPAYCLRLILQVAWNSLVWKRRLYRSSGT